jgi:purine-binding chemotaxis protein CheW
MSMTSVNGVVPLVTQASHREGSGDLITLTVGRQLFGIPVLQVQDVLGGQRITRIPLGPPEVAGSLNLRGRIITAIDMRRRLRMAPGAADSTPMSVVVTHQHELYALLVDQVGEVASLSESTFERNPNTLQPHMREVSRGVHRMDGSLLIVLDVERVLDFTTLLPGR